MTIVDRVELIRQRMVEDGNEVSPVQLAGGSALVGYQSKFRWKWMATKVHLFIVVVAVPQATSAIMAAVTVDAINHAKSIKGKFRGLQSGVAVIPILVSSDVLPEARATVESPPGKQFAVIQFPAILDASAEQVYSFAGRVLVGGLYTSWLRERLARATMS